MLRMNAAACVVGGVGGGGITRQYIMRPDETAWDDGTRMQRHAALTCTHTHTALTCTHTCSTDLYTHIHSYTHTHAALTGVYTDL